MKKKNILHETSKETDCVIKEMRGNVCVFMTVLFFLILCKSPLFVGTSPNLTEIFLSPTKGCRLGVVMVSCSGACLPLLFVVSVLRCYRWLQNERRKSTTRKKLEMN